MENLSVETWDFIRGHCRENVHELALQADKYPLVSMREAIVQIAGWQMAEKKIPLWANTPDIRYPQHLSMEQCSSEMTACYKATLVSGDTLTDLTGGLGVDCSFFARNFITVDYVEQQGQLCKLAVHNFSCLGLEQIRVHHSDGVAYLKRMDPVDWLYLDPARRDRKGGKVVLISDCEPDVSKLESLLVEKGSRVMVKLSPMLDMVSVLQMLKTIYEVHIIAVNNECKEMLVLLKKQFASAGNEGFEPMIHCEQIVHNSVNQHFSFTLSEEKNAVASMADAVGRYLYEPGAALMKGGPYKLLCERYGVKKLHANSHLYTSDSPVDFPGRSFRVEAVSVFGKKELKNFLFGIEKANLTVRNFPSTVEALRKKLKLKEGGNVYLFATTLCSGEKVLIKCAKRDGVL